MYPNVNQLPDWQDAAYQYQQGPAAAPPPSAALYGLLQSLGLLPGGPPAASAPPQEPTTAPPPPYNAHPPTESGAWNFASAPPSPPPAATWGARNVPPPPTTFDWWAYNGNNLPHRPLGDILRRMGTMVSFSLLTLLLLLLTPSWLFRVGVYLALAGWLGLHLPTLLAGHVLYLAVGGLACAEPLLAVGVLLWAAHKRLVRRQPLVDGEYWRAQLARSF